MTTRDEPFHTALAQSDAGPVAWRWRWRADPPNEWHFAVHEFHGEHIIIEPLYAAPPDASAGLMEAAEWHEKQAAAYEEQCRKADLDRNIDAAVAYDRKRAWHSQSAEHFRARAANRSGK